MPFLSDFSKSPFTDKSGRVICFLEGFGHGEVLVAKALSAHISSGITTDMSVPHVLSSHEYATGRGTDCATGIKTGEFHSLLGHSVEPRSLDQFLSEASEISIAEVVRHDEN